MTVELLPAPAGPMCRVVHGFDHPACTQDGDTMSTATESYPRLGMIRGDTLIVVTTDRLPANDPRLTNAALLDALRTAPVVPAGELVA